MVFLVFSSDSHFQWNMVCNYVLPRFSVSEHSYYFHLMLVLFLLPLFNFYFKPMTKGNNWKTHFSVVLDGVFIREQLINALLGLKSLDILKAQLTETNQARELAWSMRQKKFLRRLPKPSRKGHCWGDGSTLRLGPGCWPVLWSGDYPPLEVF